MTDADFCEHCERPLAQDVVEYLTIVGVCGRSLLDRPLALDLGLPEAIVAECEAATASRK